MHTWIHTCTHAYIPTPAAHKPHLQVCIHAHTHMHTSIHAHMCIHTNMHANMHPDIHAHIHTAIHMTIHAYEPNCRQAYIDA